MAMSSLTLFESYRFMNSGIASTLLFVYPIMVAVMMIFFFSRKVQIYRCLVPSSYVRRPHAADEASGRRIYQHIRMSACHDVSPYVCSLHCFCQCLQDSQEYPYHQTSLLCALLGMRDVSGNDTAGTRSDFAGRKKRMAESYGPGHNTDGVVTRMHHKGPYSLSAPLPQPFLVLLNPSPQ